MVEGGRGEGGGCRFSESVNLHFFFEFIKTLVGGGGGCRFSESVKLDVFYEFIKTLSMSKTCSIYDQLSSLRMIFGQYGTGNMSDQVAVINSATSTIFHFVNFHLPI